ncbi:MAG: hypothetical protein E2P03_09230 [Acidobacteria bacterium]|nr:MAG: hypothetical protein E2P03_09230 [Acidobacteriota bacterium]
MKISCHGCGRQFRVRQDKLPVRGARTRCPRCGEILVIAPPGSETASAPPTPEVETRPVVDMEGELFDLPPADLLVTEDDLFAPGNPDSSSGATETVPVTSESAGSIMEEPAGQPARAGGLRDWIARLFSR